MPTTTSCSRSTTASFADHDLVLPKHEGILADHDLMLPKHDVILADRDLMLPKHELILADHDLAVRKPSKPLGVWPGGRIP